MSHNRLGDESSPYLLQHKDNPVHWWAWGPEALAEAKKTGRPILLSVGYSACHWCHVMAHESFEDDETAAVMNARFVNIKVDREERPDIDAIYMGALHKLNQQGGWPLTMFLDSDARPFWGGTYFPKVPTYGRPAFIDVLERISDAYHQQPEKVANNANAITEALAETTESGAGPEVTDPLIQEITGRLAHLVDPTHGGITGAPKFPQWSFFWLLWRGAIRYRNDAAKQAVITTLERMSQGGIYDHLGGGFARYSVDELWLVPHFEKMLYDNALLIDLMTEVWRETKSPLLEARVAETVGWLSREMVVDGGGFAAALDADSEGEEGKFYVWSQQEIDRVLGAEDAAVFAKAYDVLPDGNWEGHTILNRLDTKTLGSDDEEAKLAALRTKLLDARASRIRPGWDDKVLADWNGLTIAALARAGVVFDRSDWVTMAREAFTYVTEKMTVDGRIVHAIRHGRGRAPGTAHDYANMIWAALRLYQATGEASDLTQAIAWVEILDRHYWSEDAGGYFTAADDTSDVIVRLRTASDDATPAANATMISNLVALTTLTGDARFVKRAESIMRAFSADLAKNLVAHTGLLAAGMDLLAPQLVVIVASESEPNPALGSVVRSLSIPGAVELEVRGAIGALGPSALHGKSAEDGRSTAYVCVGPQCSLPANSEAQLRQAVLDLRSVA
ncbi:thioredoxin domain-containing protein [Hyphomicrobium sp.]|uniref:thioredoxin domain-containing protein n=1 Tax=Hyphomicrobium sp. TaxID=82 RepID=UPI002BF3AE18|nr:thioredoxin domain-containing protein [Hyphomicrobium sp.]HRN88133.1 thioredoxin domain-containing protein [Hyphomicrobium sp.]HRQ26502.1 thioredoxin domain-containing protein [Hyphomicrobium sp.]